MPFTIEVEQEADGRWIVEVPEVLDGILGYGWTQQQALANAQALVYRVITDSLDLGEAIVHRVCSPLSIRDSEELAGLLGQLNRLIESGGTVVASHWEPLPEAK